MTPRQRDRAVLRLIATYSVEGVREMVAMFVAGRACFEVAARFGVSRQAAGIWRQALGDDVHTFTAHPEVRAIADEPTPLRRIA